MTPSGLHRQLLFYGYDEVTDFLKNSPLNRHIYMKYLDLLPERNIEVPMVRLFNESINFNDTVTQVNVNSQVENNKYNKQ